MVEGERTQNYRKPELISFSAQGTGFHPLKFLNWYPDLFNKLGRRMIFLKKEKQNKARHYANIWRNEVCISFKRYSSVMLNPKPTHFACIHDA